MALTKRTGLFATAAVAVASASVLALAPAAGAAGQAVSERSAAALTAIAQKAPDEGVQNVTAYVWASNVNVRYPTSYDAPVAQVGPGNVSAICQERGQEVVYGSYRNFWWTLIELPDGRIGWISDVFIRGGNNDEPVPGIPLC